MAPEHSGREAILYLGPGYEAGGVHLLNLHLPHTIATFNPLKSVLPPPAPSPSPTVTDWSLSCYLLRPFMTLPGIQDSWFFPTLVLVSGFGDFILDGDAAQNPLKVLLEPG